MRKFVQKSVENGIDIIRIFDALNDVDNLKVAVEETIRALSLIHIWGRTLWG